MILTYNQNIYMVAFLYYEPKEKQIANRRSAFLSFIPSGSNHQGIMIRDVFRFCLQNARVQRARKTRDLAKRSAAKSDVATSEASVGQAQQSLDFQGLFFFYG